MYRKTFITIVLTLIIFGTLPLSAAAAPPQQGGGQDYVVQAGDWLSRLADKFYGDPSAFPAIVEATNQKAATDSSYTVIDNPNLIRTGQTLYIPSPEEAAAILGRAVSRAEAGVEEKIQNAMSAGPAVIAQEAAILDYPEGWPGNWPNEPVEEYVELRPGSNGWTCIVDTPNTPGNDPMCLNETQLAMVKARYALIDPPSTGFGVGYMLQGGGPVGSPPHIMIYTPGGREDLIALSTDINPITWATGWAMFPGTPYVHLMVGIPQVPQAAGVAPLPAEAGVEDITTIKKLLSETYGSLVMAHDAAEYANLYSDDVLWAPPNGPDQTSKEGIRNGIQSLFERFVFQVNPQPEEVVVQGDFAYAIGTVDGVLTPRAGGDPITIKFRIFWLLQRESGDWKIYRQIWNNKPVD